MKLSDLALLHLSFLMAAQPPHAAKGVVELKDDCPRCQELARALPAAGRL